MNELSFCNRPDQLYFQKTDIVLFIADDWLSISKDITPWFTVTVDGMISIGNISSVCFSFKTYQTKRNEYLSIQIMVLFYLLSVT